MRTFSVSFFLGTWILAAFTTLPASLLGWPLVLLSVLLLLGVTIMLGLYSGRYQTFFSMACLLSGFLYALYTASALLEQRLPPDWEGEDIVLEGIISSIPEQRGQSVQFLFAVEQARLAGTVGNTLTASRLRGAVRLSWFAERARKARAAIDPPDVQVGERWQLVVRAKRPNGFMNPGGFDYEQWLFTQRVVATGYVRNREDNQRLQAAPLFHPDRIRSQISRAISHALADSPSAGLLQGLAVAERSGISAEQWDVLRRTGTSHLLAISGLHIGLVAGFGFLPVALLWWLFPGLYLRLPVSIAGGALGAVFALAYALLAGFSLPTQRALVMVLVLLFGLLQRQRIPFSLTFCTALLAVLLLDPLASLSVGFWLSFSSVGLLFILLNRQHRPARFGFLWLQLGLSLGMVPLTAAFFGGVSLVSPLANLVAIPWVTLLVVPLVLLGVVLLPISAELAAGVWWLAAQSLEGLWHGLSWLAQAEWALLPLPAVPWWWVLLGLSGFLFWLMPRGIPGRWLGLAMLLPLFIWQPARPLPGEFQLTVLDVGQGLASVIQTAQHTLVFDTGPKSSDSFDTGELVVLPWLRAQGIRQLDGLLVSHADNDHRGGADALLAALPVRQLWVNDSSIFPERVTSLCRAGQSWRWDEVDFQVLHPSAAFDSRKRNDHACVLRVGNGAHSVLLAADIERRAEAWLIDNQADLQVDVLLVPHHGSKTSSSPEFLAAVRPQLAVVSAGYRSRYNHPHPDVVARYRQAGIPLVNTVDTGALDLYFPASTGAVSMHAWRQQHRRFWNR